VIFRNYLGTFIFHVEVVAYKKAILGKFSFKLITCFESVVMLYTHFLGEHHVNVKCTLSTFIACCGFHFEIL